MRTLSLKSLLLPLILLFVMFLITTCSKQRTFFYVNYEATIYDSLGGSPIPDCTVRLHACNPNSHEDLCDLFQVGTAVTNGNGKFKIHEKSARSNRYFVFIKKNNSGSEIMAIKGVSAENLGDKLYFKH